jgi:sugar phosphate permease
LPLFLITGIAIGVAVPSLVKSIVIWFPPKERGFAMGIMRTGVPLMGALAAATLPSVALSFGWRTAVVALAAVIMICGAMVFVLYRENSTTTEQERGGTVPLGKLLRNRNILLGSILPAILTGAQFSLASYFMLYLIEVLDIPVVVAGEIMAIIQVSGAVGRVLWGVVSDRVFASFRKQVLILIGVISAILLAIMSFLPTGVPLWAMILVAIGLGALLLGWHAVYTVLLPELAGKELAGSAVGLGYTLIQVGAVTGPPLFGYIVDVTGGYRWAWAFLALLVGGGIPLLLPVKEEQKR